MLTAIRELTGSILPAAATHGAINGKAMFLTLLIPGGNPLLGGPLGLLRCAGMGLLAIPLWALAANRPRPAARRSPARTPSLSGGVGR